jgi:hypothetical protein
MNTFPLRFAKYLLAGLLLILGAHTAAAQTASPGAAQVPQIPRIEEENLAGHQVVLPNAASGKVAVLVLGFTKASKEPTSAWANKVLADFGNQCGFVLYQMPVLEEVPHFIRGMVISSMKKGVPESQREHFVPVLHHEADWKKLVSYKEPDDAYLVVLDRSGTIAYQMHGTLNDQNYAKLRTELQTLLK